MMIDHMIHQNARKMGIYIGTPPSVTKRKINDIEQYNKDDDTSELLVFNIRLYRVMRLFPTASMVTTDKAFFRLFWAIY